MVVPWNVFDDTDKIARWLAKTIKVCQFINNLTYQKKFKKKVVELFFENCKVLGGASAPERSLIPFYELNIRSVKVPKHRPPPGSLQMLITRCPTRITSTARSVVSVHVTSMFAAGFLVVITQRHANLLRPRYHFYDMQVRSSFLFFFFGP